MFTIRQILVRMRQGDTDRSIARVGLMGRKKLGLFAAASCAKRLAGSSAAVAWGQRDGGCSTAAPGWSADPVSLQSQGA